MTFTVLIPARLASTRLPNKPLADIAGLPMVVRVAKQAALSSASRVVVACDSTEIMASCAQHGIEAVLTRADHASGSDRLAQACDLLHLQDHEVVVNVQGDEPMIDPLLIDAVANLLTKNTNVSVSTSCHAIENEADLANPNVVKCVTDKQGMALYFSRSPIPFARNAIAQKPLRHIGIYGYRVGFLRTFPTLAQAPIELAESLEQLRVLWHGERIAVHIADKAPGTGVDTPEDLAHVRALLG
jgi:3-deoxy-manno-octulosonate cytidylyltransferase (CMP-KDO synthetase)